MPVDWVLLQYTASRRHQPWCFAHMTSREVAGATSEAGTMLNTLAVGRSVGRSVEQHSWLLDGQTDTWQVSGEGCARRTEGHMEM